MRKLERVNVIAAAILAPIALIAVVLVIWSGERTVQFAADADAQRVEVVRAADARAALLRGVTHDVKEDTAHVQITVGMAVSSVAVVTKAPLPPV